MEEFCKQPIYYHYSELSFLEQKILYQESIKTIPKKRIHHLCIQFFQLPICRILSTLTKEEQLRILEHLKETRKTQHWMWWAFPQERDSWGNRVVSLWTKDYAVDFDGAIRFLSISHLFKYYHKALEILISKKQKGDSLLLYFGTVDYKKLKSHLHLFHKASIYLQLKKIQSMIEIILT